MKSNSNITISQRTSPYRASLFKRSNTNSLLSHHILVHSNDFLITKDLNSPFRKFTKIIWHDQRRSQNGPDSEVGLGLIFCQRTTLQSSDDHISIIPVTRSSIFSPLSLITEFVHNLLDGIPFTPNITPISPQIAIGRKLCIIHIRIISRPWARIHNLTTSFIQETSHCRVSIRLIKKFWITSIHLQVIHFPFSKGLGIFKQMAFRTSITSTSLSSVIVVDS